MVIDGVSKVKIRKYKLMALISDSGRSESTLFKIKHNGPLFFNTTLHEPWDLRVPPLPGGHYKSNDTPPRSLYVGANFTLCAL